MRTDPGRRLRRRRWRAASLSAAGVSLCFVAGAAGAAGAGAGSSSQSSTPSAPLRLESQTSWVQPGQTFGLHLALTGSRPPDLSSLELEVSVYGQLLSRSAFSQSQASRGLGEILWTRTVQLSVLSGRTPGTTGGYDLCVPVDVQPTPACPADYPLRTGGSPGVYPVKVTLRNASTDAALGHLVTHLVIVPSAPAASRLGVAVIVPLGAAQPLSPSGQRRLAPSTVSRLEQLGAGLTSQAGVGLTVAPDPATLSSLADTPGPSARAALLGLRRLAEQDQVLAQPFAPVAPYDLVANGLGSELGAQLRRADDVEQTELGLRAARTTWLVNGSLDRSTAAALSSQGSTRLLVPAQDVQPLSTALTPAAPTSLDFGGFQVPALVEDPGLGNDLGLSDPVLAVHEMLAEAAQIYFESPNLTHYVGGVEMPEPRGVVAVAPPYWSLNSAAAAALLGGLATSPVIQPSTVDDLFASVTASSRERFPAGPAARHPSMAAGRIRGVRNQLTSLTTSLSGVLPQALLIGDLILASEGAGLTTAQRDAYLNSADHMVKGQLGQVTVAASAITLTSRQGKVPISIVSNLAVPIRVRVELSSSHLAFREAANQDVQTRDFMLDLRNTTWLVPVTARTTGSFDVVARLLTADGRTIISTTKIRIYSKVFSGVGVALSVTALAVLAFWWGRALQKGRRNKRLVRRRAEPEG